MVRVALLVSLVLAIAAPAAASVADVATNVARFYTGATSSVGSNPRFAVAVDALQSHVQQITAAGYLKPDGTWSDINYSETPSGVWGPWDHVRRLRQMAQAYHTPGHRLYRDATLRNQIESAIGAVETFYGITRLPLGNWWFWTVGIPLDLGPTLVLMRNDISPSVLDQATKTLSFRIGPNPESSPVGPVLVGQNLVWGALNHLMLAVLRNDAAMMLRVRDAISSVSVHVPAGADGIKSDNSFHQHGAQLYTGGYGGSFANDVARYFLFASSTEFELPRGAAEVFASYLIDGISWSLFGNYFDVSVISREVAKPSTSGYNGVAALLQAAHATMPRSSELASAASQTLVSWQWTLPVELAALTNGINAVPTAHSGVRHYFDSDYSVVRRKGYFASVKMLSSRIKSGEKTNNENLLGSRQSDGRFYLTLSGREHFEPNVWPAFDWSRLPGTVVEQKPDAASATYGFGTRAFVGGVGDGRNGAAAMDFAAINSTVTARKAYFFLDDAVVFLSNGINATSAYPVESIVQQWPLTNATRPIVADGATILPSNGEMTARPRWMHSDGIGYYFPFAANVRVKRESRSGSWSSLNASAEGVAAVPVLTMWLDHGVAPREASAEYAIVPYVTAEQMQRWAAAAPFTTLANNATASAVRDNRSGATSFAFWSSGSVDGITVDRPSLVHRTRSGTAMKLTVVDPTHATTTVRLTLPGNWSLVGPNEHVTVTRTLRATTLSIQCAGGRAASMTLQQTVRRRGVRR